MDPTPPSVLSSRARTLCVRARARVGGCARARVRLYACLSGLFLVFCMLARPLACACLCACMPACLRACVLACLRVCLPACLRACMPVYFGVSACLCVLRLLLVACMRACVRMRVRVRAFFPPTANAVSMLLALDFPGDNSEFFAVTCRGFPPPPSLLGTGPGGVLLALPLFLPLPFSSFLFSCCRTSTSRGAAVLRSLVCSSPSSRSSCPGRFPPLSPCFLLFCGARACVARLLLGCVFLRECACNTSSD